jgi:hypothetical protein
MAPTSRPCFQCGKRESGVPDTDTGSLGDLTSRKGAQMCRKQGPCTCLGGGGGEGGESRLGPGISTTSRARATMKLQQRQQPQGRLAPVASRALGWTLPREPAIGAESEGVEEDRQARPRAATGATAQRACCRGRVNKNIRSQRQRKNRVRRSWLGVGGWTRPRAVCVLKESCSTAASQKAVRCEGLVHERVSTVGPPLGRGFCRPDPDSQRATTATIR